MLPGGSRARVRRARRLDAFEGHALGLRHALGSRGHGLGLRGAVELVDQGRHLGVGRNGLAEPRQRRVGRRVAASRDLALGDRSLGRGELGLRRADLAVEGLGLVALGRQQQEPERRQRGDRDDHAQHHSVTGGHRESAPVATLVGAAPGLTKLSVSWKVTPRDFGQLAEAPAPVPAEGLGGGGATEEPGGAGARFRAQRHVGYPAHQPQAGDERREAILARGTAREAEGGRDGSAGRRTGRAGRFGRGRCCGRRCGGGCRCRSRAAGARGTAE